MSNPTGDTVKLHLDDELICLTLFIPRMDPRCLPKFGVQTNYLSLDFIKSSHLTIGSTVNNV